jgi:sodium transport system permease protein
MLWKVYGIVFRKELRELLRDRRSLFWLFAPPIMLPGIALCAGVFIGTQVVSIAQEGFPIFVQNGEDAPELLSSFEEANTIKMMANEEEALITVVVPEDFETQLETTGNANVQLVTRDNSIITFLGSSAARVVIQSYSDDLLEARLEELGVTRDWLDPITIGERRIASGASVSSSSAETEEDDNGSSVLATIFLPLAVTSWLLGGGMGLVLDTTVGEKERQTIENLLVTPASRVGIVMGKMSVVFLASMMVMGLWLLEGLLLNSLSISASDLLTEDSLSTKQMIEIVVENSGGILPLIGALILLIVPFTLTLNGLVMSWCAYASNYREANLVMALIQLGLPASVLVTIFSMPPDVGNAFYAVPFLGTIVAIRDLFSNALSIEGLVLNTTASSIYGIAAVLLAAWVFGREWSLTRGLQ